MDAREFINNFEHIASASNGVKELRDLILQLAVQGKVVHQDPNERPATELLQRLKEKQKQLVNEGRAKPTRKHQDLGKPKGLYRLPMSWEWEFLAYVPLWPLKDGDWVESKDQNPNGDVRLVQLADVGDGEYKDRSSRFLTSDKAIELNCTYIEPGDVLVARLPDPLGRACIFPGDPKPCVTVVDVAICRCDKTSIVSNYLVFALNSKPVRDQIMQYATGTTRKRVSTGNLGQLQIPIAPLEEQKRIANKVNELMTFCDQLEAQQTQLTETRQKANQATLDALADSGTEALLKENWARTYTNFDRLFRSEEDIGKLKDTILQLAFRGKLVPQNPKHVPSDLFVQSIKDEVRELRYEHGVKREKAKPATYEIRLPYELPAGWSWVTFSDIGFIGRGKSKHRPRSAPELFHDGTYPFLQTGDVSGSVEGYIKNYSKKYNDKGLAQSKLWPTGTLCITIAANIAETGILSFDACFPDSVVGFIPAQSIGNPRYFEYFVRTAKSRLEDFAPSTAQKNINLTILENVLIPLPPIEELHQIVKKIEYLFSLCDLLAKHFRHARELQSNLALASIHKVVARDYELVKTTEDRKPVGKRKILEVIIRLVDEMKKQIENTVLATILARHERDMDAKELWEKSALTIDEFYATLKREIKEGFIAEPDVATLKLVEGAD